MRARARIVAEAGGRLTCLRGEPPLLLRQTPAAVYLVGGAAGPLGGDDLRLDIEVGTGATLCLRTVAASIALPGSAPSRMVVTARVTTGGTLHWLPEQLIAAHGCKHTSQSTVELAEGAALVWRDELICGRHGESPGDATVELDVTYAGRPLLRQALSIGPSAPGWDGPALLGNARAAGSLLHTGELPPAVLGPGAVRTPLAGPATLITAVAADAHELRRYLDAGMAGAPECVPEDRQ